MTKSGKRGRPIGSGKPPGEKFILKSFRFPPDLWNNFSSLVPEKERSATIRGYIEKEIRRRAKVG